MNAAIELYRDLYKYSILSFNLNINILNYVNKPIKNNFITLKTQS